MSAPDHHGYPGSDPVEPAAVDMSAAEVRRTFSDVVAAAQHGGRITYVTHHGRRVAAIVSAEFAEWAEQQEDAAWDRLADEALAENAPAVPLETVLGKLGL